MRDKAIEDFRRAVGDRVAHVTAADNLPFIRRYGLMSAQALAAALDQPGDSLALRRSRRVLQHGARTAVLNHQRPILHGISAAARVLDGHSVESWAHALDQRVYFWPKKKGQRFAASIRRDLPIAVLWLDTVGLAKAVFTELDLAPINTGNFTQGGAHALRGDWIYVPLSKGLEAFRENRRKRLGMNSRDTVAEISLRRPIEPDMLNALIVDVEK